MNAHTNLRAHSHATPNRRAPLGFFVLILAFLAVSSLAGCVGLTGAGTPGAKSSSNAGSTSTGTLAASATSLSFGNVATGSNSPQTLTLTNTGTAPVTISQATVTGAGFSVVGGMSSVSIAAGQNHAFQVEFAPTSAGNVSGSISIASDATNSPLAVSLSGTGMAALAITAQPASQSVTVGQTATFSVAATGAGTLSYQWKKGGAAISGATAASYTTPATVSSENGTQFTVVVSDSVGNLTSNPATLTVTSSPVAPSITSQPANKTVTAGQTASFSVTATGTAPITYAWKRNGATISGASSESYTTPATAAADNNAKFTVTVTNSVSSVTSNAATLTVNVPPSISAQPASRTVTAGQTATFAVVATGTGTLSYQWKDNGAAIAGATSASYTTPATTASNNGAQFTVTVTDVVSSVTSNAATLTVNAAPPVNTAPSITTQPSSKIVTAGQTATFTVAATGTGTLSYQWKNNGAAIAGATSASYTTPATTASNNGAQFTVTVTNSVSSVTSNAATLTVNAPPPANTAPSITTQPASVTVIAGQTATFSVSAAGTAPMTYQWNKGGSAISGATAASYTTPVTTTADTGAQFTVTVTNSAGKATSNAATLTVNAATFILNASQTTLNFPSVNIGSNSVLPVTFTNAGNSNVTISNVTISGAGYTASGVSSGQIIAPGQTATLNVTFAPAGTGVLPGSVKIASNATSSPASITLSGTGAQAVSHSVTLTWTASTSTVSGYDVYRSTVSGGPYTLQNSTPVATTTYVDTAVTAGTTYYYVVTSVDSSGVQSADSAEASALVP
jgi:hypothetical protein